MRLDARTCVCQKSVMMITAHHVSHRLHCRLVAIGQTHFLGCPTSRLWPGRLACSRPLEYKSGADYCNGCSLGRFKPYVARESSQDGCQVQRRLLLRLQLYPWASRRANKRTKSNSLMLMAMENYYPTRLRPYRLVIDVG